MRQWVDQKADGQRSAEAHLPTWTRREPGAGSLMVQRLLSIVRFPFDK